ncbi:energy transducer TonB [Denitratisoma sp. DHT3]|uniref:energy transducer TonB n=1 Tax=Denitratisoma sp. DHT3 TaxID=1981880 RepID=UPI0016452B6A|nr:energy transducer TonB [Denitratisoma sp. DHT3]
MAQSARKAISKEPPVFPSEALDEGIDSGSVKVRITIAGDGSVTGAEILDAQPKRIFDKAVTRAVMRWRYEPTGTTDTTEVQLTFKGR